MGWRRRHPEEALRIRAGLDGADASAELLPEHDDAAVGGAQMLQGVDGDGPLADLRLVVARASLLQQHSRTTIARRSRLKASRTLVCNP